MFLLHSGPDSPKYLPGLEELFSKEQSEHMLVGVFA